MPAASSSRLPCPGRSRWLTTRRSRSSASTSSSLRHRSIYGRWGQGLDYFDAFLVGLGRRRRRSRSPIRRERHRRVLAGAIRIRGRQRRPAALPRPHQRRRGGLPLGGHLPRVRLIRAGVRGDMAAPSPPALGHPRASRFGTRVCPSSRAAARAAPISASGAGLLQRPRPRSRATARIASRYGSSERRMSAGSSGGI